MMTSRLTQAIATLLRASYGDSAPTEQQRDLWRDVAHAAARERDRLRAKVAALEAANAGAE